MLSGDNGILQKATTAKENTDNSQIQERINLAYHSSLVDGKGKVTEPSLENELKKEFNKDSLDEGWLDKTSVEGKWKITIDEVSLEVPAGEEADNNATIKVGTINLKDVSNLSTLYGQTTDYKSVDRVDWQLFYDDVSYIYLITSDYVPINTLPDELLKETQTEGETKYKAYFAPDELTGTIMEAEPWCNGSESSTITSNLQTNNYLKWVNSSVVETKNNFNMKAVAYMMDTSKWSNFAGQAKNAYAIGGPTLEMFVLSYNAYSNHTTKLGIYESITSNNASKYGYKVQIGDGSWTYSVSGLDTSSDNMWIKTGTEKASRMWLSSPSATFENNMMCITSDGKININIVHDKSLGFRPVVAIPKSSL